MRAFAIIVTLLLLAGCGQKGPLYLPGDEAAAERYDPQQERQDDAPTPAPDSESEN